jgi:hypothetical protein
MWQLVSARPRCHAYARGPNCKGTNMREEKSEPTAEDDSEGDLRDDELDEVSGGQFSGRGLDIATVDGEPVSPSPTGGSEEIIAPAPRLRK